MSDTSSRPTTTRKGTMRKKEVVRAILATQKAIRALPKTEHNNFGNYNYATIDQYYEIVARIATEHGLTWVTKEVEVAVGREATLHTYSVELLYEDGTFYEDYARVNVLHPLMGAQAAGSAMSYAEKIFMRMLFKVPTGEFDADATDGKHVRTGGVRGRRGRARSEPVSFRDLGPMDEPEGISGSGEVFYRMGDEPPSPPPRESADVPPSVPDDVREAQGSAAKAPPEAHVHPDVKTEHDMVAFAKTAPTLDALNNYWKAQQHVLKDIKERDEARFARIAASFRDRKTALLAVEERVAPPTVARATAPLRATAPRSTPPPRAPTRTLRAPT